MSRELSSSSNLGPQLLVLYTTTTNRYLETEVTSGSRAVLMSTILAHRTTPSWSLPSNLTLRVHPGLTYIKIHDEEHDFEYFTQQYEDRAFRVFASLQEIFAADSTSDADSSALASTSEKVSVLSLVPVYSSPSPSSSISSSTQDLPSNGIQARKWYYGPSDWHTASEGSFTTDRQNYLTNVFFLEMEWVSKETLRPSVYASVADLVHHIRGGLSANQLAHVAKLYSALIHNPYLSHNLHTLFFKMMFGLIDLIENITTKNTAQVEAMTLVLDNTLERLEKAKNGEEEGVNFLPIEKTRPVAGAAYATEKPEEVIHVSLSLPNPPSWVFASCMKCMALFDTEPRDATEAMDWFSTVLLEVNLYVFQEIWTHKIEFFFEAARKRPALLQICQILFSRENVSPTLVAIVLRFLNDRLSLLGEYDDQTAVITIRLFKCVTSFPVPNDPILAAHLAMVCFPLAAKASKSTNYYHLLRGLFRAIGGGGGRYELLYKEVLPLPLDMLESLNRQSHASEGYARDMIVKLCLTVPLHLTHLLLHLT
ncbi:hypothetical protein EDB19DRAFT_1968462 [Suillus lakei]|nr:hypothetical protein EDB19DRAFT_1968462 [Suillus lakei]